MIPLLLPFSPHAVRLAAADLARRAIVELEAGSPLGRTLISFTAEVLARNPVFNYRTALKHIGLGEAEIDAAVAKILRDADPAQDGVACPRCTKANGLTTIFHALPLCNGNTTVPEASR